MAIAISEVGLTAPFLVLTNKLPVNVAVKLSQTSPLILLMKFPQPGAT